MRYLSMFRRGTTVRTRVLLLVAMAMLIGLLPPATRAVQARVYEPSGDESDFCSDWKALMADQEQILVMQRCFDDRLADNPTMPPAKIAAELDPLRQCTQRHSQLLAAVTPPPAAEPAVKAYTSWLSVYEDSIRHRCMYCRALDESLQNDGMLCGRIVRCLQHDEQALRERRLAMNLHQVFMTHLERMPVLCP